MAKFIAHAALLALVSALLVPATSQAQHVAGIRLTQTGNTGLMVDFDATVFYTTGASTASTARLGTYYNHVPAFDLGDGNTIVRYGVGSSTGIPLTTTSTSVGGTTYRGYRGSFSHTYGAAGSYAIAGYTNGGNAATGTAILYGSPFTTSFTTSTPFTTSATVTASVLRNTLAVEAVVPAFSVAFAPDTLVGGGVSTLTYTIDNSGGTLDAGSLSLAETLPSGLEVAATPNASTTCTAGTLTAVAGTTAITYTDGAVAAGATCTVSVDVDATAEGTHMSMATLTSDIGDSGSATASLDVATPSMDGGVGTDGGIPPSGGSSGCSCDVSSQSGGAPPLALALGVLAIFAWRRRRA